MTNRRKQWLYNSYQTFERKKNDFVVWLFYSVYIDASKEMYPAVKQGDYRKSKLECKS